MRRMTVNEHTGPAAFMADAARVRASASHLVSRWVQAPIPDRREADT
jgi:hypothetical protein